MDTTEQKIGKRIKKLRKANGYTQQAFAEKIGLSTNYLSDIERGISFPRIDKLVTIINSLQCSANDVFEDVIDCGYKVKASRLSEMIDELPPQQQAKVFSVIEALLKDEK